jgi:hypothetical protein
LPDKVLLLRVLIYIFAVTWGAIQAWNYRFELFFGDSQAYFDMANYYAQGEFGKAVSLYWSPLYPMISGAMFALFKPDPYWQFYQVKFVNLFFLLVVFLSYDLFFVQLYRYYLEVVVKADPVRQIIDRNVLMFCGYALLILYSLSFGGVHQDTPDMINACTFFLSGGLVLRLLIEPTVRHAAVFGVSLGLGYLCKAIMFPMSLIYEALVLMRFAPLGFNIKNLKFAVISIATMSIFAVPWVWTLSNYLGALTFGESAKFVYINLVENKDPLTVEGLKHPPRVIFDKPRIREYATPVNGTVPFLYDLGWWTYGAKIHVKVSDLAMVILCDLLYYFETFLALPILITTYVSIKSRTNPLSWKNAIATAPIWIPPAALCAQYALVNNVYMIPYINRYFIAAYPLMMLATLIALRVAPNKNDGNQQTQASKPTRPAEKNLVNSACLITAILCLTLATPRLIYDVSGLAQERQNSWFNIAKALADAGIKSGDHVAQLGGRLHRNTQYTEPNKIKLIASVYDEDYFWSLDEAKREEVYSVLRKAGAKALIYVWTPDLEDPIITRDLELFARVTGVKLKSPFKEFPLPSNPTGWKEVPGAQASFYILDSGD